MADIRGNRWPTAKLDIGHFPPGFSAKRRIGSSLAFLLDFPFYFREEIGERCVVQFDSFAALECFDSDPDFVLEICESFALPLEQSRPLR